MGRGDYFGESTFFRTQSRDYFGDIVAGDREVVCAKLSWKSLRRIPFYERKILREKQITDIHKL